MSYDPIKVRAAELRQLLQGGTIYGRRIDWDDPDCVLVAAYEAGCSNSACWHRGFINGRDRPWIHCEGKIP